ncbi:MAG: deoxyguanosinetriphosphate triphosphohydrolase [Pirellulales bacterium]
MGPTRMNVSYVPVSLVGDSVARREAVLLAAYAMHSSDSAGRKHPEDVHAYRGPFARDRDRIVHSAAFRRLSCKTQVFMGEMGDYHRTRLTHTLEVASIARTVGRALRLNEDLVEALALAHDIGHPPFGHAGEDTLDACLANDGGFEHNRQALRIVEQLECRCCTHSGLNLTYEVLEGQEARAVKGSGERSPLLEVQVVEAADSVAYDTHDADDALEVGLLELGELLEVPLWREAAVRVRGRFSDLETSEMRRAIVHELIDWQVGDLLENSLRRIRHVGVDRVEVVRSVERLIGAGCELAEAKEALEQFLYNRVYRHPQVLKTRQLAQDSLQQMFEGYVARPQLLPEKFRRRIASDGLPRAVGDYLAGMTDRFARVTFQRQFGG